MTALTIARTARSDGPLFHVHAAGCKDLASRRYVQADQWSIEADTLTQVAETVYPRSQFGWDGEHDEAYEGDFKVLPCAGLPR